MSIGNWLKEQLNKNNMTQSELAELLHVEQSTISKWVRGARSINYDHLKILAEIFHVHESELLILSGLANANTFYIPDDTIPLPLLSLKIPAEVPITELDRYALNYVPFSKSVIELHFGKSYTRRTEEIYVIIAEGDSMYPSVKDGEYVVFSTDVKVGDNEIGIVSLEEGLSLKRVHYNNESVVLTSDNPEYPPIVLPKERSALIIGKALLCFRKM